MTKRIEDQPAPTGDGTPVWDLVVSDMKERVNAAKNHRKLSLYFSRQGIFRYPSKNHIQNGNTTHSGGR